MTATSWPVDMCPSCGSAAGVMLAEGVRLCFGCRHEWEPATTTGPLPDSPAAAAVADVPPLAPAIAAVPDLAPPDTIALARERFVGATVVVWELEVEGTVTAITDDGEAVVAFGSGYDVTVDPDGFSVVAYGVVEDDTTRAVASTDLMVAAQIIRAGAVALHDGPDGRTIGAAPNDFLPADVGHWADFEHGASYAVALIAYTFGVPNDDLLALADGLDKAADAAKGATT